MKSLLFTVDLEEFVAREFTIDVPLAVCLEFGKKGFELLLGLLEKHHVKATLFTTLEFAEFCPGLIKRAINSGNELGLHALKHSHRYAKMSEEDALRYLTEAKSKLEKMFNVKIVSFRGPQMSRPSYAVLERLGIKYDSSYHPTYVPGKYNLFFKTRKVHKQGGVTVIPVSVTPFFRLPFAWVWMRNMGLWYSTFCSSFVLAFGDYINIYVHPWEFINLEGFKGKINSMIVHKTGKRFLDKVEKYIVWCKGKNLTFMTMKGYGDGR
jgi:peptidoglycan/xylan/chitin deacetylase (PgdA/CDA1 family)